MAPTFLSLNDLLAAMPAGLLRGTSDEGACQAGCRSTVGEEKQCGWAEVGKKREMRWHLRLRISISMTRFIAIATLLLLNAAYLAPHAAAQTADERTIAKKLFQGAWELKSKGNPIASIVLFEHGLKLDRQNALAHFHLAVIYEATGDAASARKHFSEVIRIAPQSDAASKARTRLAGDLSAPQVASSKDRIVHGLEWADSDNGADISWNEAKKYCERLGGGWRLPTVAELEDNYRSGRKTQCGPYRCKIASKSHPTGPFLWSSELDLSSKPLLVDLSDGIRATNRWEGAPNRLALCVRRP